MSQVPSQWTDTEPATSNWSDVDGLTRLATYSDASISYDQVFPYDGGTTPNTSIYQSTAPTPSAWSDV